MGMCRAVEGMDGIRELPLPVWKWRYCTAEKLTLRAACRGVPQPGEAWTPASGLPLHLTILLSSGTQQRLRAQAAQTEVEIRT